MCIPSRLYRKQHSSLPRFLTLIALPFALLLIWVFKNKRTSRRPIAVEADIPLPPNAKLVVDEPAPVTPKGRTKSVPVPVADPGDDLTVIEGIGPKTAAVLTAMGITRYQSLSAANPADLKLVLRAAGLNLGDPTTWPEQARLAAAGEWTALKDYQNTLKGGRPPSA